MKVTNLGNFLNKATCRNTLYYIIYNYDIKFTRLNTLDPSSWRKNGGDDFMQPIRPYGIGARIVSVISQEL